MLLNTEKWFNFKEVTGQRRCCKRTASVNHESSCNCCSCELSICAGLGRNACYNFVYLTRSSTTEGHFGSRAVKATKPSTEEQLSLRLSEDKNMNKVIYLWMLNTIIVLASLIETNTTKICSLISQIQSYMILLVTLIFGRNSVSVLRMSTSHWPPDKLWWTHTYRTIKIKYSICMTTDWRDWQECDSCEVAYSTYSRTEMTGQLVNDFATFCISGLVHFWFNRLIKTNKQRKKKNTKTW